MDTPTALTITLFGPIEVLVEGCPLPPLRSRKASWLLALLALRGGKAVEREWLAETLWPDHEIEAALASPRVALSDVRRALGGQSARLQRPSHRAVILDVVGADVDVLAFDAAAKSRETSILDHAVALYRGPLLEGCAEEWVGQDRAAREQDCLRALTLLADAALAMEDYETAVRHYRKMISLDPWREAARRGLMEALSRAGDVNAALQV